MKIFLDLDGVIANFSKGACELLNIQYPEKREFKQWDELFVNVPKPIFYSKIKGHDFWENLELYPYANKLVTMIDDISKGNWSFLTKPMIDPGCYSGKCAWVQKHFNKHIGKLIIVNGDKSVCCKGANDVLIDDAPKNIISWANAGGHAIRWVEKTDDFDMSWYQNKIDFVNLFLRERADPIEI
jgi:5'(3')-deoxyribonucleotidase